MRWALLFFLAAASASALAFAAAAAAAFSRSTSESSAASQESRTCTNGLVSAGAGKMGVYATIEVGGLLRHLLRRQTCDDQRQEAGRREGCYPLRRLFEEILSVKFPVP